MTDELKCLAHPCDGVMKPNTYDASLTCSACQFQVADESEYAALVAGRQAAIDDEKQNPWKAAIIQELIVDNILTEELERDPRKALAVAVDWNCKVALDPSVSKEAMELQQQAIDAALESVADLLDSGDDWNTGDEIAEFIRSHIGTNPLAERAAEYARGIEFRAGQLARRDRRIAELERELSTKDDTIVDSLMKRNALERERDRAIQQHERCAEKLFNAERELAKQLERNKLLKHANSLFANSGDNDELAIDQLRRELAEARTLLAKVGEV